MPSALLSTLHLLALALGLPSVFLRGVALRKLARGEQGALQHAFAADSVWGIAALLWLATGLTRVFGPFEKGSDFYLHNDMFLLKMALFVGVVALEIWPMVTLIRWRVQSGQKRAIDFAPARALGWINTMEIALTLAIPFAASMMARGIGMRWFH